MGDQALHVALPYIELAILRQINGSACIVSRLSSADAGAGGRSASGLPIFGLNLPRIFQYSNIDEQVSGRLKAAGQINICPMTLVCSQQVAVLPDIVLLLRTETAACVTVAGAIHAIRCPCLLGGQVKQVRAVPNELLQLVCSRPVVGKEASFVPSHRHMIDQQGACGGLLNGRIERVLEGLKKTCHIPIEISHFPGHRADKFCLISREVREVLCPFGMLHLWAV